MKQITIIFFLAVFIALTATAATADMSVSRVEKLVIEKHVSRSFGKRLDLAAFGPGSGWLKQITGSHLATTISFNRVTQRDIQRFNRFSEYIGYPFRVRLSGNVLYIQHTLNRRLRAAGTGKEVDVRATKRWGFFQLVQPTRLEISKESLL